MVFAVAAARRKDAPLRDAHLRARLFARSSMTRLHRSPAPAHACTAIRDAAPSARPANLAMPAAPTPSCGAPYLHCAAHASSPAPCPEARRPHTR
ncbi:hypothetical protein B0H17DRAFT_1097733 [Mycena rosella]|uniref:Uncharacterized protein n=1 Tax=Mycena rosella TaxID=1033263 RepID=A0AAD7F5P4_MYCRO|nr:hypothetical protein B0H17DRAFT_1121990 [Mycena rosella]KAJ7657478.1 hypothetical protein B0H17DRAFT_1097733 [Mycena rosella]